MRGRVVLSILVVVVAEVSGTGSAWATTVFHSVDQNIAKTYKSSLLAQVDLEDPLTVAVQEYCGNNGLSADLAARGYSTIFYKEDKDGDSGCPTSYGPCGSSSYPCLYNAAATKGDAIDSETYQYTNQDSDDTSHGAYMGYACAYGQYILRGWWSCSTHLSPRSDLECGGSMCGYLQSNVYLWNWSLSPHSASTRILAGDFNLKPNELGAAWAASWNMDDESASPRQPTTDTASLGKIDYIWADDTYTDHLYGVAELTNTPSDHHVVHAAFVWP